MGTWIRGQFDKLLMAALFVATCSLAYFAWWDDKLAAFALQAAAGCLACLTTLVTARRGADPLQFPPDPTSTVTKASSTVETVTKTEPKAPAAILNGEPLPGPEIHA